MKLDFKFETSLWFRFAFPLSFFHQSACFHFRFHKNFTTSTICGTSQILSLPFPAPQSFWIRFTSIFFHQSASASTNIYKPLFRYFLQIVKRYFCIPIRKVKTSLCRYKTTPYLVQCCFKNASRFQFLKLKLELLNSLSHSCT